MAKKRKGANQGRKRQPATQDVPLEALKRALAWIVNENTSPDCPCTAISTYREVILFLGTEKSYSFWE